MLEPDKVTIRSLREHDPHGRTSNSEIEREALHVALVEAIEKPASQSTPGDPRNDGGAAVAPIQTRAPRTLWASDRHTATRSLGLLGCVPLWAGLHLTTVWSIC